MYLDAAMSPPDLDLDNVSIDTATGSVTGLSGPIQVPSSLVAAPNGGVPIRVFVAGSVRLGTVTVGISSPFMTTGPAIAILATHDITIDGPVSVRGTAGGYGDAACSGQKGFETDVNTEGVTGASGGGGFATAGATGGSVPSWASGGGGGGLSGNDPLVPLRGGCPAGGIDDDTGEAWAHGSSGGGAIQLSSRTQITVTGALNTDGQRGWTDRVGNGVGVTGGGAGGGIILEAPSVKLGANGKLLARGGGGGANGSGGAVTEDASPVPGVICSTTSSYCGNGGAGAAASIAAAPGAGATFASGVNVTAGGGGGGLGRIRINAPAGTYAATSSSVIAGSITTGVLATR
jgi:hypothetical protein